MLIYIIIYHMQRESLLIQLLNDKGQHGATDGQHCNYV